MLMFIEHVPSTTKGWPVFTLVSKPSKAAAQLCNMPSSVRKRAAKDGARSGTSAAVDTANSAIPAESNGNNPDELTLVPKSAIKKPTKPNQPKGRKRKSGLVFFLGGIFGILVAGFFAQKNDLFELPGFADLIADLNIDSLMEVLPAGFLQEAREIKVRRQAILYDYLTDKL